MSKIIMNSKELKQRINIAVKNVIKEIFKPLKNEIFSEEKIEYVKIQIQTFLEMLRKQNKIYDYVIVGEFNPLLNAYEFEIAYSLIKSDDPEFQDYLKITLKF